MELGVPPNGPTAIDLCLKYSGQSVVVGSEPVGVAFVYPSARGRALAFG